MIKFNIQLFASTIVPTNTTTGVTNSSNTITPTTDLSATMKEYYDTELLENARDELLYHQFSKKQTLPANHGKTVEWRRFKTYADATTPLTEGVTPDGNTLKMESLKASVAQYGDYTALSDTLELTAIDDVILGCTEEHGAQAGSTMNKLTRNMLMTNTNIMLAGANSVATLTADNKITPTFINKVVTKLKKNKAPKINGKYVCIIHPSVAEDLRENAAWIEVHKYAATTEIFNGEIGELHNVRFIEDTNAPVFANKSGAGAIKVYACFFIGKEAYGEIELDGNVEMIVKQRGSAGTADPLNQRSTIGWKGYHGARILYPERIVTFICGSSYSATDEANYDGIVVYPTEG